MPCIYRCKHHASECVVRLSERLKITNDVVDIFCLMRHKRVLMFTLVDINSVLSEIEIHAASSFTTLEDILLL